MKNIMIAGWVTPDEHYDSYRKPLEKLGAQAFVSLDPEDFKKADALLIPGSEQDINPALWGEENTASNDINDELDRVQWELCQIAIEEKKPVIGICRGMQFINVFFGGSVIQDLTCAKEHAWTTPENCHMVMHFVGGLTEKLFGPESETNTRHHQGVGRIGNGLEVLSVWNDGEDSVVEAIWHEEHRMLGVQWHPEKMCLYGDEKQKEDGEKLLRFFLDLK